MTLREDVRPLHPLVIFWIGVLTGALAVGLVFFYRTLSAVDYESAILRSQYSTPTYQQSTGILPTSTSTGSISIGTPDGNKVGIGTPDGN